MGVLNVTPDSFADGGRFMDLDQALGQARMMVSEGADIIDIGGESTRPRALPVTAAAELDRVLPVLESVQREFDAPISIDTSKPAGASMINDISALRAPGALETAASLAVPVCLMHMQGAPRTMQEAPHYDDVVREVTEFLDDRATACIRAGIPRERIAVDPGFGFGKTLEHNLALLDGLERIVALGYPVLVGLSRKSMLGKLLGRAAEDRLAGSLALALLARQRGAGIIRVHDVAPTVDTLRILARLESMSLDG
jgi:dihydropteroate synthase